MIRYRTLVVIITAVVCVAVGRGAIAADALSFNDKRMIKLFDKNYARYSPYFDNFKPGQQAEIQGYYTKIENFLKRVSSKAQQHPDVKARREKLSALKDKLDQGGTAAEAAIRKAPVRDLTPVKTVRQPSGTVTAAQPAKEDDMTDEQIARAFQTDYNDAYNTIRRTRSPDLLDEGKVAEIKDKLGKLSAHLAAIKDPDQSFVKQMQANYDSLSKHFDQAVERAKAQSAPKPQPVAVPGRGVAKQPARPATKPAGTVPAKELSYAMKRRIGLFDKDWNRYRLTFERPTVTRAELEELVGKLEKRLEPIQPADHPEVLARRQKLEPIKAKIETMPKEDKPTTSAGPPLPYTDKRRVESFDNDLRRNKQYLESTNPDNLLDIHKILDKLEKHLSLIGFHSQKHPEVIKRKQTLASYRKLVQDNFGEIRLFTEEEERLLASFRAKFNSDQYYMNSNLNPISLQDRALRKECEAKLAKMWEPLSKIANDKHPKFLREKKRYDELKSKFVAATSKSDKLETAAGDVDAQLELIQQEFPYKKFDPKIPKDATPAQVEDWAKRSKGFLETADKALDFFEKAKATSIKARSSEFLQYSYWFKGNVKSSIRSALDWAKRDFEAPIHQGKNAVNKSTQLHNQLHVKWAKENIKKGMWGATRLAAWYRGHDGKDNPEVLADIEAIKAMEVKLAGGVEESIRNNRMPKPRSTDSELIAIAKAAIAKGAKTWGIGPYEHLVINYDRNRKREGRWYGNTFTVYDWDEFQVTIAEKDGDIYWTRTCMIKNYRNPVGKLTEWKVVKSKRWNKILKENIFKPPLED